MKVLILCAGIGSRLGSLTENSPKCLVKINSDSILVRLLKQFSKFGLKEDDIYFCAGYKYDRLPKNYKKIVNYNFNSTNMMRTTTLGIQELIREKSKENILVIYGDCIYSDDFIFEIIDIANNLSQITIPVDLDWRVKWSKRYENIFDDAETLEYNELDNKLISIGKKTYLDNQYMAQFMGTYILPNFLIKNFLNSYNSLSFVDQNNISTTDFFDKSIGENDYFVMPNKYTWTEVDTLEDLAYAKSIFF